MSAEAGVQESLDQGMRRCPEVFPGPVHNHTALVLAVAFATEQDGAVRDSEKAGDVMGYDHRGSADPPGQSDEQVINFLSADRIEA